MVSRYGGAHQRLRAALLPYAVGSPCCRCGKPIKPGEPVDLDHDEHGGYLGLSHQRCNRRAGGQKASRNRMRVPSVKEMSIGGLTPIGVIPTTSRLDEQTKVFPAGSGARCAVGIDIASDRSHTSIVVAEEVSLGITGITLEYVLGSDTSRIIARFIEARSGLVAVVIDPRSPATTLLAPLAEQYIEITEPATKDVALAHGVFLDELNADRLRVRDHEALAAAVQFAVARPLAGGEALKRRLVDVDASPMTAAELAVWALLRAPDLAEPGIYY